MTYPTDDHGGRWNAAHWIHNFSADPVIKEKLEALAGVLLHWQDGNTDWRWVRRSDVFSCGEPLQRFLATMAWGFGPTGYGWRRTRDILAAAGVNGVTGMIDVLQQAKVHGGSEDVWMAFSPHGKAKLSGLRTAFASKVAYFSCYDRVRGAGPLIADRNTAWSMWVFEGVWDSRASAPLYARYVTTATVWARLLGLRSDDIERAFFILGPHIRKIHEKVLFGPD